MLFLRCQRRWLVIIPFCLSMIVGICLSMTLPKIYMTDTLILAGAAESGSGKHVESLSEAIVEQRIGFLEQQAGSRTCLEKIMQETGLCSGPEYENMFPEEKIAKMRENMRLEVTTSPMGTGSVRITFKGESPEKVTNVVRAMSAFFIDENARIMQSEAEGKTAFPEDELRSKAEELMAIENTLREYRTKNMGALPEQLSSNLAMLTGLRNQVSEKQESIRRKKLTRIRFERQMTDIRQEIENYVPAAVPEEVVRPKPESENMLKLKQLKVEYVKLTTRYTQRHPDVVKLKRKIADLETKVAEEAVPEPPKTENAKKKADRMAAEYKSVRRNQLEAVKKQYDAVNRDIKTWEREISGLLRKIREYGKRIEDTPKKEQELMSLKTDYKNIQDAYNLLLNKKLDADLAVKMERKSEGPKFRVLDPPMMPRKPVSPDLRELFMYALGIGLAVGCGLIFLAEKARNTYNVPVYEPTGKGIRVLNFIMTFFSVLTASVLLFVFAILASKGTDYMMIFMARFRELYRF